VSGADRLKAYLGVCPSCGRPLLEILYPGGAVICCEPGKRRFIGDGGTFDSCCIWGYQVHDCPETPERVLGVRNA
jgi:hypothetical protein